MIGERITTPGDDLKAALLAADLPSDDLADDGRTFYRFAEEGRTIGFGGYERYGENALLRSIVIMPDRRGSGAGHTVTAELLERLAGEGVRTAYLLTVSATGFFESLGFTRTDRAAAPAEILATRQAASLCPASATLLSRPTRW
jgi:N-acetylglutamate synthase-like GNAT family acetyltransferase